MKQKLIKEFLKRVKELWDDVDKHNLIPFKMCDWDGTTDVSTKDFTLIRVCKENGGFFIKNWITPYQFKSYELTEKEFNKLQKEYFNEKYF